MDEIDITEVSHLSGEETGAYGEVACPSPPLERLRAGILT